MAIEMEDVHEEVRALRAALLIMVQRCFYHGSDIDKKGLNGFYYAAPYYDPIKRHLATIAPYHPKHHACSHNAITTMAANVALRRNTVLRRQREE